MRSVKATKKITKAMELISASRIVKAQQRVSASTPYANELTRAVSAVASYSSVVHPLTTPRSNPRRAAVLIITADRGMAGAYSTNAIKEGEQLAALLRERGLSVASYLVGRKAVNYYKFRERAIAASWTGFSDNPTYENAKEVSETLLNAFIDGSDGEGGVDEIHIIFTKFRSMLTQEATAKRMIPLEVVESDQGGLRPRVGHADGNRRRTLGPCVPCSACSRPRAPRRKRLRSSATGSPSCSTTAAKSRCCACATRARGGSGCRWTSAAHG